MRRLFNRASTLVRDHRKWLVRGVVTVLLGGVLWGTVVKPIIEHEVEERWASRNVHLRILRATSRKIWITGAGSDSVHFTKYWSYRTDTLLCNILVTFERYSVSEAFKTRDYLTSLLDHYILINEGGQEISDIRIPVFTGASETPLVMQSRNIKASFTSVTNPRWYGGTLNIPVLEAGDTGVVKLRWDIVNEIGDTNRSYENPPRARGLERDQITYEEVVPWEAEQIWALVDEGRRVFPREMLYRTGGLLPGVQKKRENYQRYENAVHGPWDVHTCNKPPLWGVLKSPEG